LGSPLHAEKRERLCFIIGRGETAVFLIGRAELPFFAHWPSQICLAFDWLIEVQLENIKPAIDQ
jgi:hypothetical protein